MAGICSYVFCLGLECYARFNLFHAATGDHRARKYISIELNICAHCAHHPLNFDSSNLLVLL